MAWHIVHKTCIAVIPPSVSISIFADDRSSLGVLVLRFVYTWCILTPFRRRNNTTHADDVMLLR